MESFKDMELWQFKKKKVLQSTQEISKMDYSTVLEKWHGQKERNVMMAAGRMETNMEMDTSLTAMERKEMENGIKAKEPNGLEPLMLIGWTI